MNKVLLMGRLTADPTINQSNELKIARYNLAVDRRVNKDGMKEADFIGCVAFGKSAEFAEKYLHKGTKLVVEGRIQTGSYEKDGKKIYTTDIIVEQTEFAESKTVGNSAPAEPTTTASDGFMSVPDNVEDEGLPFN